MKKIIIFYIGTFLVMSSIFLVMMDYLKQNDLDRFSTKQLEVLQKTYETVLNMQLSKAQRDFWFTVQTNQKIHPLLQKAVTAKESELPYLRGELYRALYRYYQKLSDDGLRQLHFHLPDGESFLRFHKPTLNGDNLFKIRKSIQIANTQKVSVHGFEGGRVFPGFRNVFPLLIEGQHLGSVEFSYPFETIEKELKKVLPKHRFQLIQTKASTIDIVNEEFKNHFVISTICKDHVVENPDISQISAQMSADKEIQKINERLKICKRLEGAIEKKVEDFARPLIHEGKGYLINFLKVKAIDKNDYAYIVSYELMPELISINQKYNFFTVLGLVALFFVFAAVTALHYRKMQIDSKNKEIQSQALFLHKIIENAPIPIYYKTKDGRYIDCNSKFLEFFGFESSKEIIGKDVYELYPQKVAKKYAKMDEKIWSGQQKNQVYTFEAINKKTGSVLQNLEFHKSAYHNAKGEVEGLVGAIVDMNEIYKNIKEKEKYFSASMYSPSMIILTDKEGIIEYVNPSFCKVTGYRKEELIGKSAYTLGFENENDIAKIIESDEVYEADIKNKKKNGSTFIQRTKIAPYYDQDGKKAGYVSVGEDITKLNELQQIQKEYTQKLESMVGLKVKELRKKDSLLIQQSKMAAMGEMIGAIAHQWRQPLNALNINIQLLEEDYDDGMIDKQYIDDFMQRMLHKIHYMDQTINDFRNFFKPQKEKREFYVAKAVEDTLKLMDASYKASNIEVIKQNYNEQCKVYGLQNEFNQVLVNIFKNSKDAVTDNKIQDAKVYISLQCSEGELILEICDNAGGIEENTLKKVFEPYYTTKSSSGGTGIGLYMSKVIIEQNMNGKIWMQNHEDGVKTVIKFMI